jgi:hypothetical protein
VLFAVCYYGDKIKDDELGKQKGIMPVKDERFMQHFGLKI